MALRSSSPAGSVAPSVSSVALRMSMYFIVVSFSRSGRSPFTPTSNGRGAFRHRSGSSPAQSSSSPSNDRGMRYNWTMPIRFWLGVVQRDHVLRGVAGGFAQVNHGAKAPLARMGSADGFVYYSPKTAYPDGDPLKEFTAIGRIADD